MTLHQSHLQTQAHQQQPHLIEMAQVIATTMCHINVKLGILTDEQAHQFTQTYSLEKGLKKFGECGKTAATSEMKQLHDRAVFKPFCVEKMTQVKSRRAMESLIFLVEK